MKRLAGRHIYINPQKALMSIFVIIVLFRIPRSYFGIPYLYNMSYTARTLSREEVIFGITGFEIVAIIAGIILYSQNRSEKTRYWPALLYVIIFNFLRFLLGYSNPITLNSYEIILSIIVAFSCATIIQHYYSTYDDIESFLDIIVGLFFFFQMYFVLIGKSTESGSYGTVGLSSGGLSLCYVSFILLKLLNNAKDKKSIVLMVASTIGIVLSGSRTQLLLLFAFVAFYVLFMLSISNAKKWLLIGVGFVGVFIIIFGQNSIAFLANNKKIQSMMSIFSSGLYSYVTGDASASERFRTWVSAFNIIKQNPLGISCSVLDLQTRMFAEGSPTFPHSYLLGYYLLLGIPALVFYIMYWKQTIESKKYSTGLTLLLAYFMVILTFYGGIGTQYLMYFWLMMIYEYTKKRIRFAKKEQEE